MGMGKDTQAQPTPDPAIAEAAKANVELGKNWLDFAKQQYATGNVRQAATDELNAKVANQDLATQQQANTWAQEDRARTVNTFQPLQDQYIETAKNYATPENQETAAASAKADVLNEAAGQKQSIQRQMAANGISPDSGAYAGITRANDVNTALGSADAQNKARTLVRNTGLSLVGNAVGMGSALPSTTAAAYGVGTNAGTSAVGVNQGGNNNFYQNGVGVNQGYSGAVGANQGAGGIMGSLYGNQLNAWSAQQQANAQSSAGFGSLVGSGLGAYSALSKIGGGGGGGNAGTAANLASLAVQA